MKRWRSVLLALTAAALVSTACTGDDGGSNGGEQQRPSIDPAQLRDDAAAATAALRTARFTIVVDGDVPGVAITEADGQLTKDGKVKGTAVITLTGQPTESEFVLIDDTLYLKGPTGGFQELPASLAQTVFDPSAILDDQRGLPAMVRGATSPSLAGSEEVDGTQTHMVNVTFRSSDVGVLLPGVTDTPGLPGTMWIAQDDPHRLLKATVEAPGGGSVTITMSDFDAEADITAPN